MNEEIEGEMEEEKVSESDRITRFDIIVAICGVVATLLTIHEIKGLLP